MMETTMLQAFPNILKYGATGLSALLFFFAFLLLRTQCKKKDSDQKVLKEIRIYMFVSIMLAVISLVSTFFNSSEGLIPKEAFDIRGTVKLNDGGMPTGVTIITGYPPVIPEPNGEIIGCIVTRDHYGELPILAFQAAQYQTVRVDLRRKEDAIENSTIDIGEIILTRAEE